jgi:hypothetical protein
MGNEHNADLENEIHDADHQDKESREVLIGHLNLFTPSLCRRFLRDGLPFRW